MTRIRLAVLTGGNSVEGPSSYDSARDVIANLDESKYEIYVVDILEGEWRVRKSIGSNSIGVIDKTNFSFKRNGVTTTFDCVFMAIHGGEGENGSLQGYFDLLTIPYTGSGIFASALCFNKYRCKQFLSSVSHVALPSAILVKTLQEVQINASPPFPCIVKPNSCGSSFGVSKVENQFELEQAVELALQFDTEVLVEEAIDGTEVTIGVMVTKSGEEYVLPITETCFEGDVFDTESKLLQEHTQLITPARLSPAVAKRCEETALEVYQSIGCDGLVRIDFIVKEGVPYFLEVNTIPGMMLKSSIPRQIQQTPFGLRGFYEMVIDEAMVPSDRRASIRA